MFESMLKLPVNWQVLPRQFQETTEGFDCKINGRALGAALLHSLGRLDSKHKHLEFPSKQQLLQAVTLALEKSATIFGPIY